MHRGLRLHGHKIQNSGNARNLPRGVALIVNPNICAVLTVVVLHQISLVAVFHFAQQENQGQVLIGEGVDLPEDADLDQQLHPSPTQNQKVHWFFQ